MTEPEHTPADAYEALLRTLGDMGPTLVAYSGGVDSTLLAFAAHVVLGRDCVAALATSDTYPISEVESARKTAAELGLRLIEVETYELLDPAFRANGHDRCYHCKNELFGLLRMIADSKGYRCVADGSNLDDLEDDRPGRRAALECGIVSPLQQAGMRKSDVREVAHMLGLPNWDKPSMACLASRFPYGTLIDEQGLRKVSSAEEGLRNLGLRQFRVRAHGDVARLEVDPCEMERAWSMRDLVVGTLKDAGFVFASQDLEGYRTGSLNETLGPDATSS